MILKNDYLIPKNDSTQGENELTFYFPAVKENHKNNEFLKLQVFEAGDF